MSTARLFVGGLAPGMSEVDVVRIFVGYRVRAVHIIYNPIRKRPHGIAFVDFSSPAEAETARLELDGIPVSDDGYFLRIAPARPRPSVTRGGSARDARERSGLIAQGRLRPADDSAPRDPRGATR